MGVPTGALFRTPCTTIFGVIQAIPNDLWQFGFWRFIGGLAFAGIFPAINAVLTNSTEPEDRAEFLVFRMLPSKSAAS